MQDSIERYIVSVFNQPVAFFPDVILSESSQVMMRAIARQLKRGLALTDRQHETVKKILAENRESLIANGFDDPITVVDTLSMGIRLVDRDSSIHIDEASQEIVIKFPFNKKAIDAVQQIAGKYRRFYTHTTGTNEHRFKLYEPVLEKIVEAFSPKTKFNISDRVMSIYNSIKEVRNNDRNFIPRLESKQLVNVDERAIELLEKEIGPITDQNLFKFHDRSIRYGFEIDRTAPLDQDALTVQIANRTEVDLYIDPAKRQAVIDSVSKLDRFPILVVLDSTGTEESVHSAFKMFDGVVAPEQQILLNRVESTDKQTKFNPYFIAKNMGFTNWLDEHVKVVYIFNHKLPKILINSNWKPIASLCMTTLRPNLNVAYYLRNYCDLNIYLDSQRSFFEIAGVKKDLYEWV